MDMHGHLIDCWFQDKTESKTEDMPLVMTGGNVVSSIVFMQFLSDRMCSSDMSHIAIVTLLVAFIMGHLPRGC